MTEQRITLIENKEKFKEMLVRSIFKGKELYNKPIREDVSPKFIRKNINGRILEEYIPSTRIKDFCSQKNKWVSFVIELLKRSFNIVDNEYKQVFEGAGMSIYPSGATYIVYDTKEEIKSKYEYLESLLERLPLIPSIENNCELKRMISNSKRVFIVHGHDSALRLEVENLLLRLGLEPIVLFKEPSEGKTIIEKIEKEANNACFAIVLYTACDLGNDKQEVKTINDLNKRARQNVVFEHGYLLCKLGRSHVCALVEDGVERPGDMDGVVYISTSSNWDRQVLKELNAACIQVDANKI